MGLKILIVGFGSIARRHILNLYSIDDNIEVALWRQRSKSKDLGEFNNLISKIFLNKQDVFKWHPEIALITNPASQHINTALALAEQGIHLFIEKPLSNSQSKVQSLIEIVRRNNIIVMIGYVFRFYKPFHIIKKALNSGSIGRILHFRAEVGQFLPDWRPNFDYRRSVSAQKDLGGGVVMELSHELDYARWMIGEVRSVNACISKLSDLEIDVEDSADIIIQFHNGVIGSIHLDMIQRVSSRTLKVIGTQGTIIWDWSTHQILLFSSSAGSWQEIGKNANIEPNDMYVAELEYFLNCVKNSKEPSVSINDGLRVLEIAIGIKESSLMGKSVIV